MKFLVVFSLALFAVALAEPGAEAKAAAEPEADADPSAWYGYGGYGLGYRGYWGGYRGYYGRGYYGYGYAHYLGKRSADAEPEAEASADPSAWYGYGGYG